jgi:hypothetical protein
MVELHHEEFLELNAMREKLIEDSKKNAELAKLLRLKIDSDPELLNGSSREDWATLRKWAVSLIGEDNNV